MDHDGQAVPVLREKVRKPRRNKKVILLIILFFISIFALLFFHSSLSKISEIEVSGTYFLEVETVLQESGLIIGESFFRIQKDKIEEKLEQLPLVRVATLTKKFPGFIHIHIEEHKHVAFELENGQLIAVLANGFGIPLQNSNVNIDKPILSGWDSYEELKSELCAILAELPAEWLSDVSEILPDPTPSYEDRILFYSRSSYEVTTTISKLAEKLSYFHDIVDNLIEKEQHSGKVILLEADTFVPYQQIGTEEGL